MCLGTVQLGLPYGVANRVGQPDRQAARRIVSAAWEQGIRYFDTAQAYGDSETILGDALSRLPRPGEARLITKLSPKTARQSKQGILASVEQSLRNLQCTRLWALLLHSAESLTEESGILIDALQEVKQRGWADHVGVSVYGVKDAVKFLQSNAFDVLQAPYNAMDQSLRRQGVFALARKLNKYIFCRSIYLQGLLLLSEKEVPVKLRAAVPGLLQLQNLAQKSGMSIKEFVFHYAYTTSEGFPIVFGAETVDQVIENCSMAERKSTPLPIEEISQAVEGLPEQILNPSLWTLSTNA